MHDGDVKRAVEVNEEDEDEGEEEDDVKDEKGWDAGREGVETADAFTLV
jgi:hypothetical protein